MQHRRVLVPLVLLTSSCGLVLDFTPTGEATGASTGAAAGAPTSSDGASTTADGATGAGGSGDAGASSGGGTAPGSTGAGGEGAGGGAALEGAVTTLVSSTPGGVVDIQSVVVTGGVSWVAGWFTGEELVSDGPGEATTLLGGAPPGSATSFLLRLDAGGNVTATIPLARTELREGGDHALGARVAVDDAGRIFVTTAVEGGATVLDGVADPSAGEAGFQLVAARIDDAGGATWAVRCRASATISGQAATAVDVSARHGGVVVLDDGRVAAAGSFTGADSFTCERIGSENGGAVCATLALPPGAGGVLLVLDGEDGACADPPIAIATQPGGSVVIDDLGGAGAGAVHLAGHLLEASALHPWDAALDPTAPRAFSARLALAGTQSSADVTSFVSTGHPASGAQDGSLVGSTPSGPPDGGSYPASDVHLVRGDGTAWALGDASDGAKVEVATSVSVEGDGVLITGHLTENASVEGDLCAGACSGDLAEADACGVPGPHDTDGFWLLLPRVAQAQPGEAVGRAFGGCGQQSVVAGVLSSDAITLVVALEGSATVDLLDRSVAVSVDASRRGAVVARIPRP